MVDSGSHRDVSSRARARSHLSPRGGAHIVHKPARGGFGSKQVVFVCSCPPLRDLTQLLGLVHPPRSDRVVQNEDYYVRL